MVELRMARFAVEVIGFALTLQACESGGIEIVGGGVKVTSGVKIETEDLPGLAPPSRPTPMRAAKAGVMTSGVRAKVKRQVETMIPRWTAWKTKQWAPWRRSLLAEEVVVRSRRWDVFAVGVATTTGCSATVTARSSATTNLAGARVIWRSAERLPNSLWAATTPARSSMTALSAAGA